MKVLLINLTMHSHTTRDCALVCLRCGRTVGRLLRRFTVKWLPNFRGWVDSLSYGAPRVEIAFKGHDLIPFCHHCPFLKLTINVMTMDAILVIVNVVKMLLINLMTKKCWRCRPNNILSGWKKNSGKGQWKITATSDKKIMANALVDGDVSSFLLALKKESSLQITTQSCHFWI